MAVYPTAPDREKDKESEAFQVLRDDATFAAGRVLFFQYFCLAAVLYLALGYWNLQIRRGDYFAELAERNRIRSYPLLAPRGKILDRDGRIVVDNNSTFSLMLGRENLDPEQIKMMSTALNLDYDEVNDRLRRFEKSRARSAPIPIKEQLTQSELAFVESHRGRDLMPALEIAQDHRRVYPQNGFSAHILGYTGEVSEYELDTAEFARYKQGDIIGKAGLERQYNDLLMGSDGERRVVVDHLGNERELIDKKEPEAGRSIQITIDLDLQAVAELALRDRRGAVVALDPRTGEVLAMVSGPSYDPNKFAGRIRRKEWDEIRSNPDNPLFNRAIQGGGLAPGSTFKPIVAIAGLETGVVTVDSKAYCRGVGTYYGTPSKCHRVHGEVDFTRAIQASCDVFFYELGDRLHIDRIAQYAQMAGLGRRTGIDLPAEAEGIVPSTRWKIRTARKRWFAGETISVAIGQGALAVTPLQLAHAIGGLALGGEWYEPHLFRQVMGERPPLGKEPRRAKLDPANVARVLNGMSAVVNLPGGTATNAKLPGIEVCGKTGTAQLVSNKLAQARREAIRRGASAQEVIDNAWFVGLAPRDKPEIVVVALYEGGAHGDRAAPIVRDVIKAYFDKKKPGSRGKDEPYLAMTFPDGRDE